MKAWFCALLVLVGAMAACGDDGTGAQQCPRIESDSLCEPATADERPHYITPLEIYTGANGRDQYQAALQANFGSLDISSADANVACVGRYGCVAPFNSGFVAIVTAQSAGQTTLTVRSGSITETITVNVADYTPEQYDLGEQRYNNPADANSSDRVPCASCHNGQGGAPHTPLALAGKSDAELLSSIQESKYPDICENDTQLCSCTPVGEDCSACPESDCRFYAGYTLSLEAFGGEEGEHLYDLKAEEVEAIMAYIRALPLEL